MKRIPQGRYSKEFRKEAVKHVIEQGLSVPEVSRRLDISKSTLSYWVKSSKAGNLGSIGSNMGQSKIKVSFFANPRAFLSSSLLFFCRLTPLSLF